MIVKLVHGLIQGRIDAIVVAIGGMAFDLVKGNRFKAIDLVQQGLPKLGIFNWFAMVAPIVLLPFYPPTLLHGVDDVSRVGINIDGNICAFEGF